MAISVIDVRETFALPRVAPSRSGVRAASTSVPAVAPATAARRLPLTVLAAGSIGVVEALALLAVGLTGLDGLLTAATRPHAGLVAGVVVALAGWIVAVAGSGASLIDAAGRTGYVALAYTELLAVGVAGVTATFVPIEVPTPSDLPLPAFVLLLMAVPVAKLLLIGTASAQRWLAAGPRVRERRPDPVAKHRLIATLTVAAIGLGLGAVAIGGPPPGGPTGAGVAATSVVASNH